MAGVFKLVYFLTHLSSHKWHSSASLFICPNVVDFVVTDNQIFVEPHTKMKSIVL